MSKWKAVRARVLYSALLRIGWQLLRQSGSHRVLVREGWPAYSFAFHEGEEVGPRMLSKVSKRTGLQPEDL